MLLVGRAVSIDKKGDGEYTYYDEPISRETLSPEESLANQELLSKEDRERVDLKREKIELINSEMKSRDMKKIGLLHPEYTNKDYVTMTTFGKAIRAFGDEKIDGVFYDLKRVRELSRPHNTFSFVRKNMGVDMLKRVLSDRKREKEGEDR